jgi:Phage integrase, N-terminal SAM-like domain
MAGRRRFGRVRRLPSGRFQARYPDPGGLDRAAPNTFATKTDADVWLTMKEAEIRSGDWLDPDAGAALFGEYSTSWVAERPHLRPKTVQLYEGLVRLHMVPVLGKLAVAVITTATVRRWRGHCSTPGSGRSRWLSRLRANGT